jgi:hypothetical protein
MCGLMTRCRLHRCDDGDSKRGKTRSDRAE